MGNSESFFQEEEQTCKKVEKKQPPGGYKNKEKPRPGYYLTRCDVYYGGEIIKAHRGSFKKLKHGWAKDKTSIYYKGEKVKGVVHSTFRMDPEGRSFGYDTTKSGKERKWLNGKIWKE